MNQTNVEMKTQVIQKENIFMKGKSKKFTK